MDNILKDMTRRGIVNGIDCELVELWVIFDHSFVYHLSLKLTSLIVEAMFMNHLMQEDKERYISLRLANDKWTQIAHF